MCDSFRADNRSSDMVKTLFLFSLVARVAHRTQTLPHDYIVAITRLNSQMLAMSFRFLALQFHTKALTAENHRRPADASTPSSMSHGAKSEASEDLQHSAVATRKTGHQRCRLVS